MADLMPVIHTAIHTKQISQYIPTGVSYMTAMVSSAISILVGFGLGWYVKGRGWFGVKMDASNVASQAEKAVSEIKSV